MHHNLISSFEDDVLCISEQNKTANGNQLNPLVIRHGSLFSGIGGFDLAAQWTGWENVFQVEIDDYCLDKLAKNFPTTKRYKGSKIFEENVMKKREERWCRKCGLIEGQMRICECGCKQYVNNQLGVTSKQWRSWTEKARQVFTQVFSKMKDQRLIIHPKVKTVAEYEWETVRFNAAWLAADAVDGNNTKILSTQRLHVSCNGRMIA